VDEAGIKTDEQIEKLKTYITGTKVPVEEKYEASFSFLIPSSYSEASTSVFYFSP